MKALFYISLFFAGLLKSFGQHDVVSSNTFIETCIGDTQCTIINNSGYLFYDDTKTALYFKVNFRDRDDSTVAWLEDLSEGSLYFKVIVPPDFFKGAANFGQKTHTLTGQVFLNGFWQPKTVDVILSSSENNPFVVNTGKSPYDNYKISLSLAVLPEDFRVHEKAHHLVETISIGLASGRINELKPGMESLLGEAYNHY
ncbi:MAG: hypothetical protein K0S33_3391 [Bacteroidetes bacterium]|jgi:hypothetical protein|nr:hypothetical protein [Bacteroidota bacterium]